ncbi:MAG: hypothetical protein Q9187_001450 [Circinaria calcarea]
MAESRKRSYFDFTLHGDPFPNKKPRKRETLEEHNRRVRGEERPANEDPPPWPPQGPLMSECPPTPLFLSEDEDDDDDEEDDEEFDSPHGDGSSDEGTRVYETRQEVWGQIIQYRDSKGVQKIHKIIPNSEQQVPDDAEVDVQEDSVEVPRRKKTRTGKGRRDFTSQERMLPNDEVLETLRPANQPPPSNYVSIRELNELGHRAFEELDKGKVDRSYDPNTMDLNFKHRRVLPRIDSHRKILERSQHQSGYADHITIDIEYPNRPVAWDKAIEHNRLPFEPFPFPTPRHAMDSANTQTVDPARLGSGARRTALNERKIHIARQRRSVRIPRRDRFGRMGTKSRLSNFIRPPKSPLPGSRSTLQHLPEDDVGKCLREGTEETCNDGVFGFDSRSEEARARACSTDGSRPSQRRTSQLRSSPPIPSQPRSQSIQGTHNEHLFGFVPPDEEQRSSQPARPRKQPGWANSEWMIEIEDPTKKFWSDQ